tara:strand:- start:2057 stop:2677 length:621 start_codon:yes stop_codon:yes gene_type:complete
MKDINLNNIKVFYEDEYDGGGYRLVDGLFNHPRVKEIVKGKQKVLELCSGPGFFGFYLLGGEPRQSLHLTDINEDLIPIVRETIIQNDLHNVIFETKMWPAEQFDLVVLNPPHHNDLNPGKKGEFTGIKKLINYDEDWFFHKMFFDTLYGHLTDDGYAVVVENYDGSTPKTFEKFIPDNLEVEYIENKKLGWVGSSNFFIIILSKK